MKAKWDKDTLTCTVPVKELAKYGLTLETFGDDQDATAAVVRGCAELYNKKRSAPPGFVVGLGKTDKDALVRLSPAPESPLGLLQSLLGGMPADMPFGLPLPSGAAEPGSPDSRVSSDDDPVAGFLKAIFGGGVDRDSSVECGCPACRARRERERTEARLAAFDTLDEAIDACAALYRLYSGRLEADLYKYNEAYYLVFAAEIPAAVYEFVSMPGVRVCSEFILEHGEAVCAGAVAKLAPLA